MLEQVRKEQQECLTSHKEIATAWSVKEKQRLNADRQRLERAKDHLKLDKEHMESEKSELSREVLIQTEEFEDKKKELVQLRGNLQVREGLYYEMSNCLGCIKGQCHGRFIGFSVKLG